MPPISRPLAAWSSSTSNREWIILGLGLNALGKGFPHGPRRRSPARCGQPDDVRFLGSRLDWQLGWRDLLVGSRGLVDRRSDLRRSRSADPLLLRDPALQIGQVIANPTAFALPDLDEWYPELPGAAIAAQHVQRDAQPTSRNMLGNCSRTVRERLRSAVR